MAEPNGLIAGIPILPVSWGQSKFRLKIPCRLRHVLYGGRRAKALTAMPLVAFRNTIVATGRAAGHRRRRNGNTLGDGFAEANW